MCIRDRDKDDALVVDCFRDMFRLIERNGVKVGTLADTSIGCIGIIDIDDSVWQVTFVGNLLLGEKPRKTK